MDIYTYFFFSYGLTAIIAFFTVGIILVVNKLMRIVDNRTNKSNNELTL